MVSMKSLIDSYIATHEAILRRHPEDQIPSYDKMKQAITEVTGVSSVVPPHVLQQLHHVYWTIF